jgi:AcrR family transcriptional regulator
MVWQRARSEDQKEQRRVVLLEAAARLHEEHGIEEISLNAIAREANISKANVYRYFESREELFLQLTLEALARFREALSKRLQALAGTGDAEELAKAWATCVVDNPRFARLSSVLSTVLERNVSTDAVVRFKTSYMQSVTPLVQGIVGVFPRWTLVEAQQLLELSYFVMAGMWPSAHPPPAVSAALERPELTAMCIDFEPAFTRSVLTYIRGIEATSRRPL